MPYSSALSSGRGAALQRVREGLPFDVLHDDEIDAVLLTHVIKRADVRVIELRDRLGLALETRLAFRTLSQVLRKHLDGDRPVETGVVGFVDLPHSPFANWGQDFVRA